MKPQPHAATGSELPQPWIRPLDSFSAPTRPPRLDFQPPEDPIAVFDELHEEYESLLAELDQLGQRTRPQFAHAG